MLDTPLESGNMGKSCGSLIGLDGELLSGFTAPQLTDDEKKSDGDPAGIVIRGGLGRLVKFAPKFIMFS